MANREIKEPDEEWRAPEVKEPDAELNGPSDSGAPESRTFNSRTGKAAATSERAVPEPRTQPLEPEDMHQGQVITTEHRKGLTPKQREQRTLLGAIGLAVVGMAVFMVFILSFTKRTSDALNPAPHPVTLVQPQPVTITNTMAIGGQVVGVTETAIGDQQTGTVQQLLVKQGDRVKAGQVLAVVNAYGSENQSAQAQQELESAQSKLSELEAMTGPGSSSYAGNLTQSRLIEQQTALAAVEAKLESAQNALEQAESGRSLSRKMLNEEQRLVQQGILTRAQLDQAQRDLDQANQKVAAARRQVQQAASQIKRAAGVRKSSGVKSNSLNAPLVIPPAVSSQQIRAAADNVQQAQQALNSTEQPKAVQVKAPFDGIVKAINAQVGEDVGDSGVLTLDSNQLVIRAHVDQNNVQRLAVGQEAVLSSTAAAGATLKAKVTQIGAAVEPGASTVAVDVTPEDSAGWVRLGQSVTATVTLSPPVQELVIPESAVSSNGAGTSVFAMEYGRAVKKEIVTQPATVQGVPVVSGLSSSDRIVADVRGIQEGERITGVS